MRYRVLGSTGLKVSVIGVGTWQLGGEWGKAFTTEEVTDMLAEARNLGVNFIDTAECYGDHVAERLIGAAIGRARKDWIIATKFGHKFHSHMNRSEPRSAGEIAVQLEDSLRALGTDYIDIYQYHSWGDEQFDDMAVLEFLKKQQRAGRIRHIGVSISKNTNMHQTGQCASRGIEVLQVIYNRLDRAPEKEVLPSARGQNVGVLARVPLASGLLSGKYKPGVEFPADDVRAGHDRALREARLAEVERIAREEVPAGMAMSQWALAWCLKNPAVTAVIPGCKSVEQVRANARAGDIELQ